MVAFSIIVLTALLLGYFLPTVYAFVKHSKNVVGIFVLNLFLGWTFVGWVIALVWALREGERPVMPAAQQQLIVTPHSSVADELAKLEQLRKDGVLTDEEFDRQKQTILRSSPPPADARAASSPCCAPSTTPTPAPPSSTIAAAST